MESLVWVIAHLGGLGLMLLTAWSFGRPCVKRIRCHSALERRVFALVLGLGLCALVLFGLGLLGLLYRGLILGLTWAGALGAGVQLIRRERSRLLERLPQLQGGSKWRVASMLGLIGLGLGYWALLLTLSQYPPVEFDAVWYHLVLARTYLSEHRVMLHAGAGVPVLPLINHLLFTWALAVKDDILAQMINHSFTVLTALGLCAWGRRQCRTGLGLAAAALWLAHPLVIWLSKTAYVDLGVTCFVFFGVYALGVFSDGGEASWWLLGVALLAEAAGAKMPGLIFLAIGAGLGLWASLRSKLSWRSLAQGGLLCLLVAGPFYGFIAYHTGNPVWPLFPQLSRGIWGSQRVAAWNHGIRSLGLPKTFSNYLMLPVHIALHPERFVAERGLFPLILIWPLAWLIAGWDRRARWWSGWVLAFSACWFLSSQQMRHWVPALPMVGLALCESLGWALEKVQSSNALRQAVWAGLMAWGIYYGARFTLDEIKSKGPIPVTTEARNTFLANSLLGYQGAQYINDHAAPGEIAYVLNSSWLDYYLRLYVIDRNSILERPIPTFNWPGDEPMVRQLESQKVTWLIYCPANPRPWKLPTDDPRYRPQWPPYQLVYEDPQLWVYRHAPPGE